MFASTVVSTKNETTLLMFACESSNNEVVNMLLHFGADPHLHTKHQEMEQLKYALYIY